eukprot:6812000-Pyramimonas_sp.AAC.1
MGPSPYCGCSRAGTCSPSELPAPWMWPGVLSSPRWAAGRDALLNRPARVASQLRDGSCQGRRRAAQRAPS